MIKLYYNLDNIKEIRTMIFKEKFDLQISYIYIWNIKSLLSQFERRTREDYICTKNLLPKDKGKLVIRREYTEKKAKRRKMSN